MAFALAEVDAEGRRDRGIASAWTRSPALIPGKHAGDSGPAIGVGHVRRIVLLQLSLVFPDYLAALLSRQASQFFLAADVLLAGHPIFHAGHFCSDRRMDRRSLDYRREKSHARAESSLRRRIRNCWTQLRSCVSGG